MFTGPSTLTLDGKGRIMIPTRYRDLLGKEVVLTADPSGCLLMFMPQSWKSFAERVAALPNMNPRIRALQRVWLGCQVDVELDTVGRVLLPAELREHAGLEGSVRMFGQGDRFELWSNAGWAEVVRQAKEAYDAGDLPPELMSQSV